MSGTTWVGGTDFLTARPKPSRAGGADAKSIAGINERTNVKANVSHCASMAARFRILLCDLSRETSARGVRGLSPKAGIGETTTEVAVSVCSFDSDLLGEGVVERKGKENRDSRFDRARFCMDFFFAAVGLCYSADVGSTWPTQYSRTKANRSLLRKSVGCLPYSL